MFSSNNYIVGALKNDIDTTENLIIIWLSFIWNTILTGINTRQNCEILHYIIKWCVT